MSKIKIRDGEKLFHECREIAARCDGVARGIKTLSQIVQNDMEVEEEQIREWEEMVKQEIRHIVRWHKGTIKDLWDWHKRVKAHIGM